MKSSPELTADLDRAAARLKEGGVVAFPTETVYGLGAIATNVDAVNAVFRLKGRPSDNPLIVHIPDSSWLKLVAKDIPDVAFSLFSAFSPGPLTLVLKKQASVPEIVTAGLDTVAVRIPDHEVARKLIERTGKPLVAPSANISGKPSPTTAAHVAHDFSGQDLVIVDGGAAKVGVESTVLDLTVEPPVILRPGIITADDIAAKTGISVRSDAVSSDLEVSLTPKSPGQKYRHYAPSASVILVPEGRSIDQVVSTLAVDDLKSIGVFSDEETLARVETTGLSAFTYGEKPAATKAAKALYAAFRYFDDLPVHYILVPLFPERGAAIAYNDRVRRAAEKARRVLFVCTGNTCRSPMAEALFNHLAPKGWRGASAGIYAQAGQMATAHAIEVMRRRDIEIAGHRARPVTWDLLRQQTLIVPLTKDHAAALLAFDPSLEEKILPLSTLAPDGLDIGDPYGQTIERYEQTAEAIEAAVSALLLRIEQGAFDNRRDEATSADG